MATKKKHKPRERTERRFIPKTTTSPLVVYVLGAAGAILLGAGVWGQFGNALRKVEVDPYEYAPWILAAGAVALGIAVWLGTSTEAALRVGIAGLAVEGNPARRMPWWRVEHVTGDEKAVVVTGTDENNKLMTVHVSRTAIPGAIAWVLREARERARDRVEVSDDAVSSIGKPSKDIGEIVPCPPLQVVGQRCGGSDKMISYEPDARSCPKCERVYHKDHVPKKCVSCGGSLEGITAPETEAEAEAS